MRIVEGNLLTVTQGFYDDYGQPLYPLRDDIAPIVTLIDPVESAVLLEVLAVPAETAGEWTADLAIPDMELLDDKHFIVLWMYKGEDNTVRQARNELIVEPAHEHRSTDIVVVMDLEETFDVSIPQHINSGDKVEFSLALNNQPIVRGVKPSDLGVEVLCNLARRSTYRIPLWAAPRKLEPMALMVKYENAQRKTPMMYTYKLWAATPQMLIGASLVMDHIDKARAANVIPQLEYTQADVMGYLYRGLALFNQIGARVTGFNGMNMQGTIMDAWITCSCYYALSAQLQAEGQMAFDFTGQVVNLNMDRTPSIEAALGRLEAMIQGLVTNAKNKIVKAGVTGGDGSEGGGNMDGSRALGVSGVSNAPTTKWATVGNRNIWVNTRYRVNG